SAADPPDLVAGGSCGDLWATSSVVVVELVAGGSCGGLWATSSVDTHDLVAGGSCGGTWATSSGVGIGSGRDGTPARAGVPECGRDRRRSGDLPLFRRSLCQLSYPTVLRPPRSDPERAKWRSRRDLNPRPPA